MATFDITQLVAGSAYLPGASFPTTAGIDANQVSDGACYGATTTRSSAGVYTLPLSPALSGAEHHGLATGRTAGSYVNVAWTSTVLLTLSCYTNSGTAAASGNAILINDVDLDITVFRTRRVA